MYTVISLMYTEMIIIQRHCHLPLNKAVKQLSAESFKETKKVLALFYNL